MQNKPAQTRISVTLYSSVVGLLLTLGIGTSSLQQQTTSPETKTISFPKMIQQQVFNNTEEATAITPQVGATSELPDLSDRNVRVGLQVGHFENDNPPAELSWLKGNTGANAKGKWEDEVVGVIVVQTRDILEQQGVKVDILPAVIPPGYRADAYISIHTDGSDTNKKASGFKVAPSAKDRTGLARKLSAAIDKSYEYETGLRRDGNNITRNMTHHYSFAYDKYEHAISSETPAALLETGFLTNDEDFDMLVNRPEIAARGLAYGVLDYLDANF